MHLLNTLLDGTYKAQGGTAYGICIHNYDSAVFYCIKLTECLVRLQIFKGCVGVCNYNVGVLFHDALYGVLRIGKFHILGYKVCTAKGESVKDKRAWANRPLTVLARGHYVIRAYLFIRVGSFLIFKNNK